MRPGFKIDTILPIGRRNNLTYREGTHSVTIKRDRLLSHHYFNKQSSLELTSSQKATGFFSSNIRSRGICHFQDEVKIPWK